MLKLLAARLAMLASILALSACSMAGPEDHTFVTANHTLAEISAIPEKKNGNKANPNKVSKPTVPPTVEIAMKQAASDCKNQARAKGIKSILAIVSHMKPGAVDADYVDCMKNKGYDVAK